MHLTILGGGPAGLGLAHYAHRAGMPFDLYEQSEVLGGLCHTFHAGRHAYDAGAHRFHDRDPAITADVRALLGDELQRVTTRSKIFDRGRFVDFPPTPLNLLRSHDPGGLLRSAVDLLRARLNPSDERSFEDHAVRRFGRALAERYLLGYSEKVWGLPAAELSPDVATRRLSGMSLTTLVHELLGPGRAATHIDGAFYYPRRGYGAIALALAASVPEERLHRGKRVTGLRIEGNGVTRVRFDDGTRAAVPAGGRVVSTLPITALAGLCGDAFGADALAAAERLRFRTIRLFFLRLLRPRVTDNATLYLPDRALCLTRVHEPKNRSAAMGPPEETALVCEVPCFPGDALATPPSRATA